MIRACPRCTAELALAQVAACRERLDDPRTKAPGARDLRVACWVELAEVAERGLYAVADGAGGCCPDHIGRAAEGVRPVRDSVRAVVAWT